MSEASSQRPELVDYIVSYAGLISLATISIYAGSFASLKVPKSKNDDDSSEKEQEDEEEGVSEEIRLEDAYWLPILGSVVLFSLYIIIKYVSVKWVNLVLQWYFSVVTIGSSWTTSRNFVRFCLGPARWRQLRPLTLSVTHGDQPLIHFRTPTVTLLLVPFVLYPAIVYLFLPSIMQSQHAVLINIMGLSLTHTALASIKLDSLITGVALLCGLFLYDIWWVFGSKPVFGSNVMVTVAQGLDAPIKILFPKSRYLLGYDYTMLGLGDIVVPGMFIAYALRYDLHRSAVKDLQRGFPKPFFIATLISYVIGLATTVVVMHTFQSAQPALLYLSPACIISFLGTGLKLGEWADIWTYSDTQEEQKDTDDPKKKID